MLAVSNPFLCCEMKWINYLSKKTKKKPACLTLCFQPCAKKTLGFLVLLLAIAATLLDLPHAHRGITNGKR